MAESLPIVLRHEYGTPRYLVAAFMDEHFLPLYVESPVAYEEPDLEELPEFPSEPGFYILGSDRDRWVPTDGLTYRTWSGTIRVHRDPHTAFPFAHIGPQES